jgi:hypothetical protein
MHHDQIMESYTPLNNYLSNYVIKLHIKLQVHRVNLDLAIWQCHLGDVELVAFECWLGNMDLTTGHSCLAKWTYQIGKFNLAL